MGKRATKTGAQPTCAKQQVVAQPSRGAWGYGAASRLRETPAGFPQNQYFWLRFYAVSLGIAMDFPCLDPSTAKHLFQNTELHVCIKQPGARAPKFILGLELLLKFTDSALQILPVLFVEMALASLRNPRSIRELRLKPAAQPGAAALVFVVRVQERRTGWILATALFPTSSSPTAEKQVHQEDPQGCGGLQRAGGRSGIP